MSVEMAFVVFVGAVAGIMDTALYYNLYYGSPAYVIAMNGIAAGVATMMALGAATYESKR